MASPQDGDKGQSYISHQRYNIAAQQSSKSKTPVQTSNAQNPPIPLQPVPTRHNLPFNRAANFNQTLHTLSSGPRPNLLQTVPTQHNSPFDHATNLNQTPSSGLRPNKPTSDQFKHEDPSQNSLKQNQPLYKPQNKPAFDSRPMMQKASEILKSASETLASLANADWRRTEEQNQKSDELLRSIKHDVDAVPKVSDQLKMIPNYEYLNDDYAAMEKAANEKHDEVVRMLSKFKAITVTPQKRQAENSELETSQFAESGRRFKQPKLPAQPVAQIGGSGVQLPLTSKSSSFMHSKQTQSSSQTEGQPSNEAAQTPTETVDQLLFSDDEEIAGEDTTATTTKPANLSTVNPKQLSASTTNKTLDAPQLQDEQSDSADELDATTRHPRATRTSLGGTSRAKPATASKKKRKTANEIVPMPFYVHLLKDGTQYQPIAELPVSVKEAMEMKYNAICLHKDYKVRYGRMTRNPNTYAENKTADCVISQLIGHGRNHCKWAGGNPDFACDSCVHAGRLCVRIRTMDNVSADGSLQEHFLCIYPLPVSNQT